ncbi:methyltransferase domain-containing protein [Streptomyces sp. NBC_00669]|uniref:methyltransferase domain-containing protein n=1 Tax=Streptomyces sp. NBC_00669 TaxID=2976011 RepID=UPI002E36103A|nr:methyltransferase domain-containing protein [Streptomyces sp. NBC_00669]
MDADTTPAPDLQDGHAGDRTEPRTLAEAERESVPEPRSEPESRSEPGAELAVGPGAGPGTGAPVWSQERYRDGMFSHAVDGERGRLQLLESVLDEATRSRLTALGLKPGDDVLEVGGGAGSVARWTAGQGARVTVTDLDTAFLGDLSGSGVRVLRHDMYTEDFPPESFDVVHTRFVLLHLPDPDRAVARLASWLKPGGVLLVEEPASFPVLDSPHAAYCTVMRAFRDHLERALGSHTAWARSLPVPLQRAGLGEVGIDPRLQVVYGGGAETRWWQMTLEQAREGIVAAGLARDADFEAAYREMDAPDFVDLSVAVFAAWGRRVL